MSHRADTRIIVNVIQVKNAIARKSNKASTIKLSVPRAAESTMMNDSPLSRRPGVQINRPLRASLPPCLF